MNGNNLPDIAGTFSGRLVIVGDGRCVWDDLDRLGLWVDEGRGRYEGEFMAVNKIGEVFPGKLRHWYSNDGKHLPHWVKGRRPELVIEFEGPEYVHSGLPGGTYVWPWPLHGSSGLNAVYTGLALGYDEIVLCGMPLDDSGHNGEPPRRKTNFTKEVAGQVNNPENSFWKNARLNVFGGKVRSMSGRTREWLGSPGEG